MKSILITCILFIGTLNLSAQTYKEAIIKGKVTADLSDLQGIYIINASTEKSAITAAGGYFEISASVGDTLMFSSTLLVARRLAVRNEDLNGLLFVRMEVLVNRLDEVIVRQYRNISAEALGIIPKGQRTYTPAERKLNTASNAYEQIGLNTSASLDPVLNWMSGRTAMLKKEAEIEKKEGWLEVLSDMYSGDYLSKLKIPDEYIGGFFRYCVDNPNFIASLKAKNKTMAAFQLAELAVKYNEIIALESK